MWSVCWIVMKPLYPTLGQLPNLWCFVSVSLIILLLIMMVVLIFKGCCLAARNYSILSYFCYHHHHHKTTLFHLQSYSFASIFILAPFMWSLFNRVKTEKYCVLGKSFVLLWVCMYDVFVGTCDVQLRECDTKKKKLFWK